jgi:DNA-binding response OmpR family regulator
MKLPQHILVVDDDPSICHVFKKILEQSAFNVDVAYNGLAGWNAILAHPYDLVITDQNMPKLSGLEMVKRMRSAQINLPVILISGTLPTNEICQNEELQLTSVLEKPCSFNLLLKTIKTALREDNHSTPSRFECITN